MLFCSKECPDCVRGVSKRIQILEAKNFQTVGPRSNPGGSPSPISAIVPLDIGQGRIQGGGKGNTCSPTPQIF